MAAVYVELHEVIDGYSLVMETLDPKTFKPVVLESTKVYASINEALCDTMKDICYGRCVSYWDDKFIPTAYSLIRRGVITKTAIVLVANPSLHLVAGRYVFVPHGTKNINRDSLKIESVYTIAKHIEGVLMA